MSLEEDYDDEVTVLFRKCAGKIQGFLINMGADPGLAEEITAQDRIDAELASLEWERRRLQELMEKTSSRTWPWRLWGLWSALGGISAALAVIGLVAAFVPSRRLSCSWVHSWVYLQVVRCAPVTFAKRSQPMSGPDLGGYSLSLTASRLW